VRDASVDFGTEMPRDEAEKLDLERALNIERGMRADEWEHRHRIQQGINER